VNVQIDGRIYPTSLYFLTIAESGERKTAVDAVATQAQSAKYEHDWPQYIKDQARHRDLLSYYEQARKEIVRTERDPVVRNKLIDALEDPGPPPLSPLTILEDLTYEGIYKHLLHDQPSIGVFSSEGGVFVGGYGMSDTQSMKTLGGFNRLWDGKPINRSRSGDGTTAQFGRRVSLHLMVQPVVASTLLTHPQANGMGFLARCLIASPPSTMGSRLYKEANLQEQPDSPGFSGKISSY
jgi:hypothetical protein